MKEHQDKLIPRSTPLRRAMDLSAVALLALALVLSAGCGGGTGDRPTAKQVLERSVEKLLSLNSYYYSGTSKLTVTGATNLANESSFDTTLKLNNEGALDGHMVVKSPGASYETYTQCGVEYTRQEGGDWYRVSKGTRKDGFGMVSAEARRIIAQFADLAEDIRFDSVTPDSFTVSLRMGERYREGASVIAGADPATSRPASPDQGVGTGTGRETVMTITVDRKSMFMKRVVMTDTSTSATGPSRVTVLTRGTYSRFNMPVDIDPPAEALHAPEKSE